MPVRNRAMTRLTASSVDTRGSAVRESSTQAVSSLCIAPVNGHAPCTPASFDFIRRGIVCRERRCAASTYLPIILNNNNTFVAISPSTLEHHCSRVARRSPGMQMGREGEKKHLEDIDLENVKWVISETKIMRPGTSDDLKGPQKRS